MFGVIWIQGHLILSDWEYISRSGLQLKTHELRGQMLEDELELVEAVIDGINARAEKGGYLVGWVRLSSQ
jgi:hypothetical protein